MRGAMTEDKVKDKRHTVTDCHRLSQTVTDCHRLSQTVTDCHRLSQTVSSVVAIEKCDPNSERVNDNIHDLRETDSVG